MRTLFITLALVGFGCGDDGNATPIDAPVVPPIDAAPVVALDCPTFCAEVMTNCTGANAQYADMAHCIGSCAAFTVGTSKVTDTSGDTLGCRIYHAGAPAKMDAALHCPHAGPSGDKLTAAPPAVCSGAAASAGNLCTNFCALEIKTCGSTDAPVTVGGTAITPQYKNQAACEALCNNGDAAATPAILPFDKTHLYGPTAAGSSLACRVNHWTNAANFAATTPPDAAKVNLHCSHAAAQPTGPCAGTATP
jgi:hypothetical protein